MLFLQNNYLYEWLNYHIAADAPNDPEAENEPEAAANEAEADHEPEAANDILILDFGFKVIKFKLFLSWIDD